MQIDGMDKKSGNDLSVNVGKKVAVGSECADILNWGVTASLVALLSLTLCMTALVGKGGRRKGSASTQSTATEFVQAAFQST